jgi:predicted metal-binding membrane protein
MPDANARTLDAASSGTAARGAIAFRVLIVALAVLAWLTLYLWSVSPYARYLDHGGWLEVGALAALCRAIPAGESVVPALLHAAAWLLMIAAMMLPTTVPILELFRRMTSGRADDRLLLGSVIAGYLLVWFAFGLVAHALDALVHAVAAHYPLVAVNGWMIGAAVVAVAGAFQFSALKYRCLDECHTPLGFVLQRWHGRRPVVEALRIGLDHGAFCVGCCWALMLLMFVVGAGSLGLMLLLALVMAAEKNLPWGKRLRTPLGVSLLAGAVAIAVWHLSGYAA